MGPKGRMELDLVERRLKDHARLAQTGNPQDVAWAKANAPEIHAEYEKILQNKLSRNTAPSTTVAELKGSGNISKKPPKRSYSFTFLAPTSVDETQISQDSKSQSDSDMDALTPFKKTKTKNTMVLSAPDVKLIERFGQDALDEEEEDIYQEVMADTEVPIGYLSSDSEPKRKVVASINTEGNLVIRVTNFNRKFQSFRPSEKHKAYVMEHQEWLVRKWDNMPQEVSLSGTIFSENLELVESLEDLKGLIFNAVKFTDEAAKWGWRTVEDVEHKKNLRLYLEETPRFTAENALSLSERDLVGPIICTTEKSVAATKKAIGKFDEILKTHDSMSGSDINVAKTVTRTANKLFRVMGEMVVEMFQVRRDHGSRTEWTEGFAYSEGLMKRCGIERTEQSYRVNGNTEGLKMSHLAGHHQPAKPDVLGL